MCDAIGIFRARLSKLKLKKASLGLHVLTTHPHTNQLPATSLLLSPFLVLLVKRTVRSPAYYCLIFVRACLLLFLCSSSLGVPVGVQLYYLRRSWSSSSDEPFVLQRTTPSSSSGPFYYYRPPVLRSSSRGCARFTEQGSSSTHTRPVRSCAVRHGHGRARLLSFPQTCKESTAPFCM